MRNVGYWRVYPALAFVFVVQTTWLSGLTVLDVRPDLLLLLVLATGVNRGVERGAWAGFFAGFLLGAGSGWHLGSFLVSRVLAGAVAGYWPRLISRDNPLSLPFCALVVTAVADLSFLIMSPTDFPVAWWLRHAALAGILHAALILPVHWVMERYIVPRPKLMFG